MNMPGMSGYETATAIRLRDHSAGTPIIFVTAYQADELDKSRAYEVGAADFLFTPVIPQILRAKAMVFVALAVKNAEAKRQAARLEESTEELVAANERLRVEVKERELAENESLAKDEFLAMLGHELRNPLSAIQSASALMSMPTVSPAAISRAKAVVVRQSRHLTRMVDELLDLSRALSSKLILSRHCLDFSDVVRECLLAPHLAERLHERKLHCSFDKVEVYGDRTLLYQIVCQLIENALKYTAPGQAIEISTRAENGVVKLIVRDDGIGIPSDLLPRLFNVFVQGNTTIDRRAGGLGIGLALAYKLSEIHGGTISAYSDGAGCGSTFTVSLPLSTGPQTSAIT